jgi:hypothetical protein
MANRTCFHGIFTRIFLVLCVLILPVLTAACGNKEPDRPGNTNSTPAKSTLTVTVQPGPANASGAAATGTSPSVPTPTFTPPSKLPKVTLDFYSFGSISSRGVTVVTGPFEATIPLESSKAGLTGQATAIQTETTSGGCNDVRTTQEVMDVTATGKDTLSIVIIWHATVLSTTGDCSGIPPPETITSEPVELPFVDGATKKVEYPSSVGDYYETYTLHVK